MWHNVRAAALNATLQLLVIYRCEFMLPHPHNVVMEKKNLNMMYYKNISQPICQIIYKSFIYILFKVIHNQLAL